MSKRTKINKNGENDDIEDIWLHLHNDLANYEYWRSTRCTDWDVTTYDESLARKQYTSRRACHLSMSQDLDVLANAFINTTIMREVTRVKRQLGKAKKDAVNNYFWNDCATALQEAHIVRQKAQFRLDSSASSIQSSLMAQHSRELEGSSIGNKRPQESSSAPEYSKKRSVDESRQISEASSTEMPNDGVSSSSFSSTVDANATLSPPLAELVESDGVICDSTLLSIATIIKRKAIVLHDEYKRGNPLSPRQRKIMSNGLSSILDLVDQSYTSQRKLFTATEWQQINELFQSRHTIRHTLPLDPVLSTTLKVIGATLDKTSNIKMGLLYLYKIYGKHHSTGLMPALQIFEHMLNLLDQDPHLLQDKPAITVSEMDYVAYIWLPLFRKLFHAGTNVQIRTGESVFPFSADCKQRLYPGASKVTGFKIDLRFVVRQADMEFDVCSTEACCYDAKDDKIIADEGKLHREVKDDLDAMLTLVQHVRSCAAWGIQIMGPSCLIFSMHLSDRGLYVAIPRFDITLPRTTADLIHFEDTMANLLTFRHELLKSVNFIMEHCGKQPPSALNRHKVLRTLAEQDHSPQRDSWYTPPEGTTSRRPVRLVGAGSESLNAKLLSIACEEAVATLTNKPTDANLVADEFGWAFDGEVWRNLELGISTYDNPYDNEK